MRHSPLPEQVDQLNQMLRGHDGVTVLGESSVPAIKVPRTVERYSCKILSSRSSHGAVPWDEFRWIKSQFPLLKPKLHFSYPDPRAPAKL
jgi:RNA-directed DNA polymerase